MQHQNAAGLAKSKREKVALTTGALAIQVWYRAEDFPTASLVKDCAALDFEDVDRLEQPGRF
jgi:hypothetical protein